MLHKASNGGKWLCHGLAAALLLLGSCGGQQSLTLAEAGCPAVSPVPDTTLPPLPGEGEALPSEPIPRESSLIYTWDRLAEEFYSKNDANVTVNAQWHWLQLVSSDTEASWVIYQFSGLLPEDEPRAVTLEQYTPLPALYYVLFPDYTTQAWCPLLVENTERIHTIELDPWPNAVSPNGSFYVAVLGWGNQPATIHRVSLDVDLMGPAPDNVQASDGEFGDRIAVTWEPVSTATGFNVFRDGSEEENQIGSTDEETLTYDDFEATNLDIHTYRVQAIFDDEVGRLSVPDTGFRNGWHRYAIDSNGIVGMYASMKLVDGKPALSYYDFSNGNLKYARALTDNPASSSDWQIHIVDFNHQVGELTSLALLDGKPIISYFDNAKGNLKFARAKVAEPSFTTDWVYHTVDSEGWVGEYNSLAVVGSLPAISYYDYSNMDLKYARAITPNPAGESDWVAHTVESTGHVGRFTSLIANNGKPAVSYYSDSTTDLRFAQALISEPSDRMDWRVHIVDGEIDVGLYSELGLLGTRPMISYYDWSSKSLKFALALSANPTSGADWSVHFVNAEGTICLYPSLMSHDERPVMSYYGNGDLYYARALTDNPLELSDWQILPVDNTGAAGNYSSLVFLDERPAIAYYGNPGLMFASMD